MWFIWYGFHDEVGQNKVSNQSNDWVYEKGSRSQSRRLSIKGNLCIPVGRHGEATLIQVAYVNRRIKEDREPA